MELVCELPSAVHSFVWLINGETAQTFGLEILLEKGITSDNTLVREEHNRTFITISIEPRPENNNTSFTCVANFLLTAPLISAEVVFRVQGERSYTAFRIHRLWSAMIPTRSAGTST